MTLDLINNAALLLAVCWLQSLITHRWSTESLKARVVSGLLFGISAVIVMMMYIYFMPGLWSWVDASIVIVSVSALLYGGVTGGITALIACAYRLWIGGMFATAGTVNIMLALLLGLAFRVAVQRGWLRLGWLQLLVFGLITHIVAFLQPYYFTFAFPEQGLETYILTVLAVMAPATAILGLQLQYIERKKALEVSVRRSEARLRAITEAIPDQLVVFDRNERFIDVLAPSALVANASRFVGQRIRDVFTGTAAEQYQNLIKRVFSSGNTEKTEHSSRQAHPFPDGPEEERTFESKASPVDLPQAEDAVLVLTRDITERRRAEERVRYLAYYDLLTGLPNRHLALETLEQILSDAALNNERIAVLLINLDKFKLINEIYGFNTGSEFLKEAARRLREACAGQRFVARYAGDQFLVVMDLSTDKTLSAGNTLSADDTNAIQCCRNILFALGAPYMHQGEKVTIHASLGLSTFPGDSSDVDTLFRQAGTAVERAKQGGSLKYAFYSSDMDIAGRQEMDLRNALSLANVNGEFELFYQPIVSLESGMIAGVEALMRWNHPQLGMKDPSYFMPIAEDTGLIVPMGEWVIRQACLQAAQWRRAGLSFGAISVNISTVQLERSRLETVVAGILDDTGLPPGMLHLELTESTLLRTLEHAFLAADQLKAQGVGLAVDNFGTGYTRFDNLKRLNIARLKIDRGFVSNLVEDEDSRAIVSAMIQMSATLRLDTVAIGVETEACLSVLKSMGCKSAQGYYFSRPLNAEGMGVYLQQHQAGLS